MPLLTPETVAKMTALQVLDDAIAFRLNRLNLPCPDCAAGQKCTDHAYDVKLMDEYQGRYASAFSDALTGLDPGDIEQVMRRDDGTPATVGVLSATVLARLRELAADGPVRVRFGGREVMIERDGRNIATRPLSADDDARSQHLAREQSER